MGLESVRYSGVSAMTRPAIRVDCNCYFTGPHSNHISIASFSQVQCALHITHTFALTNMRVAHSALKILKGASFNSVGVDGLAG